MRDRLYRIVCQVCGVDELTDEMLKRIADRSEQIRELWNQDGDGAWGQNGKFY